MDVATLAKTAVQLAGNLCGVPGIPILADAIVTLIETCENIPKQKQVHWVHVLMANQLTPFLGGASKTCSVGVWRCWMS